MKKIVLLTTWTSLSILSGIILSICSQGFVGTWFDKISFIVITAIILIVKIKNEQTFEETIKECSYAGLLVLVCGILSYFVSPTLGTLTFFAIPFIFFGLACISDDGYFGTVMGLFILGSVYHIASHCFLESSISRKVDKMPWQTAVVVDHFYGAFLTLEKDGEEFHLCFEISAYQKKGNVMTYKSYNGKILRMKAGENIVEDDYGLVSPFSSQKSPEYAVVSDDGDVKVIDYQNR